LSSINLKVLGGGLKVNKARISELNISLGIESNVSARGVSVEILFDDCADKDLSASETQSSVFDPAASAHTHFAREFLRQDVPSDDSDSDDTASARKINQQLVGATAIASLLDRILNSFSVSIHDLSIRIIVPSSTSNFVSLIELSFSSLSYNKNSNLSMNAQQLFANKGISGVLSKLSNKTILFSNLAITFQQFQSIQAVRNDPLSPIFESYIIGTSSKESDKENFLNGSIEIKVKYELGLENDMLASTGDSPTWDVSVRTERSVVSIINTETLKRLKSCFAQFTERKEKNNQDFSGLQSEMEDSNLFAEQSFKFRLYLPGIIIYLVYNEFVLTHDSIKNLLEQNEENSLLSEKVDHLKLQTTNINFEYAKSPSREIKIELYVAAANISESTANSYSNQKNNQKYNAVLSISPKSTLYDRACALHKSLDDVYTGEKVKTRFPTSSSATFSNGVKFADEGNSSKTTANSNALSSVFENGNCKVAFGEVVGVFEGAMFGRITAALSRFFGSAGESSEILETSMSASSDSAASKKTSPMPDAAFCVRFSVALLRLWTILPATKQFSEHFKTAVNAHNIVFDLIDTEIFLNNPDILKAYSTDGKSVIFGAIKIDWGGLGISLGTPITGKNELKSVVPLTFISQSSITVQTMKVASLADTVYYDGIEGYSHDEDESEDEDEGEEQEQWFGQKSWFNIDESLDGGYRVEGIKKKSKKPENNFISMKDSALLNS
ncbi:hypothetical protein HK100_006930, partial [Physocladia obscura]